ncbi:uncharacterized protein LOC142243902 [Anomaloglossus baeobatrachus]|uniref:uncharacterized protein LOC142243902 n=1 Tax=Anomaloglossus baeobatrachus TaxID=238106 RepID=UPI003F4F5CB9
MSHQILLGLPWLRTHEPSVSWGTGDITRWGSSCHETCLKTIQPIRRPPVPESLPGLPSAYWSFVDVFDKKESEVLPPHRPYDCAIDLLPGTTPPRGRIYPLSPAETRAMSTYITESLAKGFIRRSSSPAGAGFFFVKKKEGDLRPCIDYRGLNLITVKNKYPLPLIPELFDRLRGARVFTKLDLRGVYNLVRIRSGDEWKTAFNTRDGHYEYCVMPFGLCNAPAVFQELVNDVFRDLLYVCVVVYLDDILVFSPDLQTHRENVQQVLQRLRENRLYAKYEKCVFEQSSLPFLGYLITDTGLQMDPKKVSSVLNWPPPSGLKAIQRFLGFANYYRQFIPHFSALTAPLSALTKKGANPKDWSPAADAAFGSLKRAFASSPVLHRPELNRQFTLEVDASSSGAGAVLMQKSSSGKMDDFYIQKHGTAIGSNVAPAYANLFMDYFEGRFVYSYPAFDELAFLCARYIDDIFCIWQGDLESLLLFDDHLNNVWPELKFTLSHHQREINFLDTYIKKDIVGNLSSDLYRKPTDRNCMLLYSSCHPKSTKNSLPRSQFARVTRIVSDDNTREQRLEEMSNRFVERNYPITLLKTEREKLSSTTPSEIDTATVERIPFVHTYHPSMPKIYNIINRHWPLLKKAYPEIGPFILPPIMCKKRPQNIKDSLVKADIGSDKKNVQTLLAPKRTEDSITHCYTLILKPTDVNKPPRLLDKCSLYVTLFTYCKPKGPRVIKLSQFNRTNCNNNSFASTSKGLHSATTIIILSWVDFLTISVSKNP